MDFLALLVYRKENRIKKRKKKLGWEIEPAASCVAGSYFNLIAMEASCYTKLYKHNIPESGETTNMK